MRTTKSEPYVHALRFAWLNRFYDGVVAATLPERALKQRLCEEAAEGLEPGQRVLDLGCGTGTLTLLLKARCPEADVVGLDGDGDILERARAKAQAVGIEVTWHRGDAAEPPFDPGSFDRIVSSLFFHHLRTEDKRRAFASARRLLRPGGRLHVLDWGKAQNALMRLAFLPVQVLDGFATTADNVQGLLPDMIREAGFADVQQTVRRMSVFGTLAIHRAASSSAGDLSQPAPTADPAASR